MTFDALDRRLRQIPDGPEAVLKTPRWALLFNLAGCVGVLLGLLPIVLIHFVTPARWMIWLVWSGLGLAVAGFLPGFVRSIAVLSISFWHWRTEQVRQLDHELAQFRELRDWLSQFSIDSCVDALRFTRVCRERLASKLGLIAGSLDKLGILPVAVAVVLQLRALRGEISDIPQWQAILAAFLVTTYAIGFVAALMRLRLDLYEQLLEDSLAARGVETR